MQFQPNDELTIRLTVVEWNQVLAQLQEGKWILVNPLILKIQQQAQATAPANGVDAAVHIMEQLPH